LLKFLILGYSFNTSRFMGNRPFILPARKKKKNHDLPDWGNLKNRFSGRTLFRSILYELETGELSSLDILDNKWFYDELFAYLRNNDDVNMSPVLKKIAGSVKFSESIRQHASELEEIIEEHESKTVNPKIQSTSAVKEKTATALMILAGTRYPHTTEILRLLRDMSPDLKRLALFLIGKFKMTDMIQDVCECLNIAEIQEDAVSVLIGFGSSAEQELERCYLSTAGNVNTNRIVLRILSEISPSGFFADRLWSSSRQVKEYVLTTLLDKEYTPNQSETERLKKEIIETYNVLAWIVSAQISLADKNKALFDEMHSEYYRWKNFLHELLILTYNKAVSDNKREPDNSKDDSNVSITRVAEIFFNSKSNGGSNYDPGNYQKIFKKLQRYLSCEVPDYRNLLEYIINCDYNLLSIWTKASALRSISGIDDENLSQSAIALLFSPEALLREEAARLISRSDKELYTAVYNRIPELTRRNLDRIINETMDEKEFIFQKVRFLSSCFKELNEEELINLAQNTSFISSESNGNLSLEGESLIWIFREEGSDPEVVINYDLSDNPDTVIEEKNPQWSFCYVLPLKCVTEFKFQYPESSFWIFKYIDNKEE
jgi:hypothetical protein